MSKVDLSKRYAKALFAISKESGSQTKIYDQLKTVSQILSVKEINDFIKNPNTSSQIKKETIKKALSGAGLTSELSSFIDLLLERKRISILPEIVHIFEEIVDTDNGLTRGYVTSAKALSKETIATLETKISQILKKKITLTAKEDPTMIAGVVAKVGGWTFDDSLEMHLKKLNEELLNH